MAKGAVEAAVTTGASAAMSHKAAAQGPTADSHGWGTLYGTDRVINN